MRIQSHRELQVFMRAYDLAMELFEHSKSFPFEEKYSLTDQIRRSSRSVCANIAEAWRKRRYPAAFISKLNDVEAEIAETQTWLDFAFGCNYVDEALASRLDAEYESLLASIVGMIVHSDQWCTLASPKAAKK